MISQVSSPNSTHALRQPNCAIRYWPSGGCTAIEMPKPSAIRLIAKPRLRLNHCATRFVLVIITEPCPKKRSAANPSANEIRPAAAPNAMQANPSKPIATIDIRREP
jgi:hypothetical protein